MSAKGRIEVAEAVSARGESPWRTAWLSDEVLLLSCPPGADPAGSGGSPRQASRRPLVLDAKAFIGPLGRIFAVAPADSIKGARRLELVDHEKAEAIAVDAVEIRQALTDLRTFLREGPAGWDAEARAALLEFLPALGAEHGLSPSLGEGLRQVRDALRERQPVVIEDRRVGRGIAIERLHRIDERRFYVRGRAWDEVAPITTLAVMSPEGERVELLQRLFRHPGREGAFSGLFELSAPSRGAEGWVVDVSSGPGRSVETSAALAPDPMQTILTDAAQDLEGAEILRERHLRPAIARLVELRRASAGIVEVAAYGRAPRCPAVSVVVPLQRRVDLIEHQFAQFAADPELLACELLYVLDDPEQGEGLQELGGELFALYGLPFRLAALTEAAGLPIACDLGASLARGERLVLLGADVLPDRPGWLGVMAAALDADPAVAAATPKLLYADEAIDQAGLEYSDSAARGGCPLVRPRLRGMHRSNPAAAGAVPVAAAGLACLMVDATAFHEVGGLRAEYGLGQYEGADLSRRLAEAGHALHYVPEAELYRLEGLGAAPEALGESYARWLHSRLWGDAVAGTRG
jgi:GT2 family glycosyltransferase